MVPLLKTCLIVRNGFVSRRKLWLTNSCWNTRTVSVKSRRLPAAYQIRYKVSVQIHGWRGSKVGRVQPGNESGVRKLIRVIPGRHVARIADLDRKSTRLNSSH